MKIQELNSLTSLIRTGTGVERRDPGPAPAGFRAALSQVNQGNHMQRLQEMCDAITKQGAAVARRCDILELKRYKEMVAEFMYEAVRFSYEFKKQSSLDARGRHRMYSIIKRVNQKLEELTRKVLESQAETLSVMDAIDEIRGMLVDLLL